MPTTTTTHHTPDELPRDGEPPAALCKRPRATTSCVTPAAVSTVMPRSRASRGFSKQTGLADARLAAKHERSPASCDLVQERRQQALFLGATE